MPGLIQRYRFQHNKISEYPCSHRQVITGMVGWLQFVILSTLQGCREQSWTQLAPIAPSTPYLGNNLSPKFVCRNSAVFYRCSRCITFTANNHFTPASIKLLKHHRNKTTINVGFILIQLTPWYNVTAWRQMRTILFHDCYIFSG